MSRQTPEARADYYRRNRVSIVAKRAAYRERNPERVREQMRAGNRKYQYGVTRETYDAILFSQNNLCAICLGPQQPRMGALCVDHCHVTGVVRGLLCSKCNTAIGLLMDDPAIISGASEYVS